MLKLIELHHALVIAAVYRYPTHLPATVDTAIPTQHTLYSDEFIRLTMNLAVVALGGSQTTVKASD